MILKIERYIGSKENKIYQDWWLLDDIRKVSKAEFDQPFSKDFESGEADIFVLDYESNLQIVGTPPPSRKIVKLVCRLGNGSELCVIFDTMAYVLNDNGKTIEKIVANYRYQ